MTSPLYQFVFHSLHPWMLASSGVAAGACQQQGHVLVLGAGSRQLMVKATISISANTN